MRSGFVNCIMAEQISCGQLTRNNRIYTWRFYENGEVKIFNALEYQYSIKFNGRDKKELLKAIEQGIDNGKPPARTVNNNYNQVYYDN